MKTQTTAITDEQRLVSAVSRFGSPYKVYDDGFGPLWIHRDSMGISGIVRAQTWEDAYSICEDEFFTAADEDAQKDYEEIEACQDAKEKEHLQACWDEAYGYRGNNLRLPDGTLSFIYARDLNGDALDRLTDALCQELGITIEIEDYE